MSGERVTALETSWSAGDYRFSTVLGSSTAVVQSADSSTRRWPWRSLSSFFLSLSCSFGTLYLSSHTSPFVPYQFIKRMLAHKPFAIARCK